MDKPSRQTLLLAAGLTAAIFMLDWATPLFYAVWILYVIPLLIAARPLRSSFLVQFTVGIPLLILAGFFLAPLIPSDQSIQVIDAVNRVVGGAALIVLGFSLRERSRARDALLEYQKKLEHLVDERTAELQASARQLSVERARLDNVLRQMPVGVMIADAASGRVVYANERASRIREGAVLDASEPEYQGFKSFHADGRPFEPWEMPLYRALTGQETVAEEEMRYFRIDGTTGILSVSAVAVRDRDGATVSGVLILNDVTERTMMEEELKSYRENLEQLVEERTSEKAQLEEGLRQAQKMESVGTLASGIAHDFNNILAAILGNAELAQEELAESSPVRGNIDQILQATFRGRDLVKRVLAFSRKPEKELRPVALTPLLEETFKLLRASLPVTVEMKLMTAAKPDIVRGDPSDIQQVVMNLSTNASHAMREGGGQLEIALHNVAFRPGQPLPEPDMAAGDYLALSVKDTGQGMAPEVLDRIFEPFFTTKPQAEGTGLGLYVVYGIVKSLKGGIRVVSKPRKGAIFTVYLPSFQETADAGKQDAAWSSIQGGIERVLFIDDEAPIAELGAAVLSRLGYNVTTLTSATDAFELFSKDPKAFDIVVTDQTMPGLTGMRLAAKLLRTRPDLPIVLCSGYSENISRAATQEIGIREFLIKPIAKRELAEAVRRALEKNT